MLTTKANDAHFKLRLRPADEMEMRQHLDGCAECRASYQQHLLLARLDPAVPPAQERIASGLGLSTPKPHPVWRWAPMAAACAVAVVAMILWTPSPRDDGFTARGAKGASPSSVANDLAIYRAVEGKVQTALVSTVHAHDELAFAYKNEDARPYLMVFGVSDAKQVYWFYPSWTDARENPRSIAVEKSSSWRPLADAVTHDFKGNTLTVYAVFSDAPLTVKEVERRIRQGEPIAEAPSAATRVVPLKVESP